MEGRYTYITYGAGYSVEVEPKEKSVEVLSYLITGREFDGMEDVIITKVSPCPQGLIREKLLNQGKEE